MTRSWWGRVVGATALFLCLSTAVAVSAPLDLRYELDVAFSPLLHTIGGTARVAITNRSGSALREIMLLLYPNRYEQPDPALDNGHIQAIYPRAFNPGNLEITGIAEENGTPLEFKHVDQPGFSPHTVVQVIFPQPLEPEGSTQITITFVTTIPEKLGVFGYLRDVTAVKGGWYPYVAAFRGTEWALDLLPDQSDVLVRLTAPQGVIVAGAQLTQENAQPGWSVWTSRSRSTTMSLAFSQEYERQDEIDGETRISYFFLPSDRRYVPPIMETLHRGLAFFRKEYGDTTPIEIVFAEAHLHQELVSAHENVSLISARLFKAFWPLQKYHETALVKGLFLALWRARLPEEETWVLEGLAEAGSQVYIQERYPRSPDLLYWLKPLSFLPVIDQILYSKNLPLRQVYFHETTPIVPREDPALFNNKRLDGTSMFFKLTALFNQEAVSAVLHRYVELIQQGSPKRFRVVVEEVTGQKIDWFYQQWLTINPSTNFAISSLTQRRESDGYHTTLGVTKFGTGVEPVIIRLTQQHGPALTTRWLSVTDEWMETFVTPSPVEVVEVDPEHVTSDFERFNNRRPPKIKFILEQFPGISYDFQTHNLSYDVGAYFQRLYDDRNLLRLTYSKDDTTTSGGVALSHSFDHRLLSFSSRQSLSLGISHNKQNVPLPTSPSTEPYTTLRLTHVLSNAKVPLIYSDEIQRLVFGAFPYSTLTTEFIQQVFDADHPHAVKLKLDIRRQWPIATLQEVAGRFVMGESFGGLRQERHFELGGSGGMRGYSPNILSGESIVIASLEYRHPLVREVATNAWGLTVLRKLQAAVFADIGTVSSYSHYLSDVGGGIRITHDILGLYPLVARFDVAFPINVEDTLKPQEQNPHYYFTAGQPF